MFDPFEYLALRHKSGLLRTDFKRPLGKISYHVACHLRVQNIGLKTRDVLQLIPGTTVEPIERCSGHNGTYGVKREFRDTSMKIGKPVFQRVQASGADFYASDCPMAGHQIESGLDPKRQPTHPLKLLRMAYGIGALTIYAEGQRIGSVVVGAICTRASGAARTHDRVPAAAAAATRGALFVELRGSRHGALPGA